MMHMGSVVASELQLAGGVRSRTQQQWNGQNAMGLVFLMNSIVQLWNYAEVRGKNGIKFSKNFLIWNQNAEKSEQTM